MRSKNSQVQAAKTTPQDRGNALITTTIILSMGLLTVAGLMNLTTTTMRTTSASRDRAVEYSDAEASVNAALSWLRFNSQSLISPFRRAEFYNNFRRQNPALGTNDSSAFQVPTRLKLNVTNLTPLLTSTSSLGTAAFPTTTNIVTLQTFPAISSFQGSDHGNAEARITIIDALPKDVAKDFGPPPSAVPQTDFMPIFRIDAMSSTDSGSHVQAIVEADFVNLFDVGFYGEDYLDIQQECDSYKSELGHYTAQPRRANCPVASNSTSAIHKTETVYGSLRTNGSITESPPNGGKVCADFQANCPNPGSKCQGPDCSVPLLEQFAAFNVYCPQFVNPQNVNINGTPPPLVPTSDTPTGRCWNTVTVGNNSVLKLTSTTIPYYIKTLSLGNNCNSRLEVEPDSPNGMVELYIESLGGNQTEQLNGCQAVNTANKPSNFSIYYLGTKDFVFNGNSEFRGTLIAPKSSLTLSGSSEFYGAALGKELHMTGSGSVHYDESLRGYGKPVDLRFKVRELTPFYR